MASVGVRELQQHASAVLRRVEAGETIDVTDRGRRVARLVPVAAEGRLDQLVKEGRARAAEGTLDQMPPPLTPLAQTPLPSAVLAGLRANER